MYYFIMGQSKTGTYVTGNLFARKDLRYVIANYLIKTSTSEQKAN